MSHRMRNFHRMNFRLEMATRGSHILVFLLALVVTIEGFEPRGRHMEGGLPTPEDCMRPPLKRFGRECCKPPKEKIWGDLKGSLTMCLKKLKPNAEMDTELMRQEAGEGSDMTPQEGSETTPATEQSDSASTPTVSPHSTEGMPNRRRKPWRKSLSERVKNTFTTIYKELKNTIDALWQSVVIIADHFRRHMNDSCFMECVFEDQGFLENKMLNKEAMLARLTSTLATNDPWREAAVAALETCYSELQTQPTQPTRPNGSCRSGSEEIFRCTFKQIFLNCPNWIENDYCSKVKEFYEKCPNGPPPETIDNHTTAPPQEEIEVTTTGES